MLLKDLMDAMFRNTGAALPELKTLNLYKTRGFGLKSVFYEKCLVSVNTSKDRSVTITITVYSLK